MGLKFIFYGHGTMGLETGGHKVLVDPFFTGNPSASTSADAVEADFILVSHGHGDHVGVVDARKVRCRSRDPAERGGRTGER